MDVKRLKVAKDLGADHVITVERGKTAKEVASKVKKLLGKAPNKVIECTGAESSIITGIYVSILSFTYFFPFFFLHGVY